MCSSQTIDPDWVQPDTPASRHSIAVAQHLRGQIEDAGGVLPFDQYMDIALYAPGLGTTRQELESLAKEEIS